MTDRDVKPQKHKKTAPSRVEQGKLGQFAGSLDHDVVQEMLKRIQTTIGRAGSKHMVARKIRWFHRHRSPKAIKRKRVRRLMTKKSRRVNAKRRK